MVRQQMKTYFPDILSRLVITFIEERFKHEADEDDKECPLKHSSSNKGLEIVCYGIGARKINFPAKMAT